MSSADAVLRLALHLDPASVGQVNVNREVFYLYGVGRRIRTDRCSSLLINLSPSGDSRISRGRRWLHHVKACIPRQAQRLALAIAYRILIDGFI
jgi:hypothetical protein